MPTKEDVAERLAHIHYRGEQGMTHVFRLLASDEAEARADEPIKLLEVNADTIPAGIMPLQFGPDPSSGICYRTVIVEITPGEFAQISEGKLKLPEDWELGDLLPCPAEAVGAPT